jgi:hypothetical protein
VLTFLIRDCLFALLRGSLFGSWFAFWIVVLVLDRFLDLMEGV